MAALNVREACRKYGHEYLAICGLHKYFPTMNAESHVFFVTTAAKGGDDDAANLGQTPDTPLLTITKALSYCTTNKNDYIFVLDYYQPTGETWPISIAKGMVHIIGITGKATPWPWVQPTSTNAAFSFTTGGAYCEIAGLCIGGNTTTGCIDMSTSGLWGNHIHDCDFGSEITMTSKYGIYIGLNTEMIYGLIENCRFGGLITSDGIYVISTAGPNSVKGLVIRNNFFSVDGKGINVADVSADFQEGGIFYNNFEVPDSADGEAVYFASGAKGNVHGNAAWTDDGVIPANNPFFDAGTTNMSWGANIRGGGVATGPYLATPTNI